jgi:tetratricopeptide (TPR) repeat protein
MNTATAMGDSLVRAEGLLVQGQNEAAEQILVRLAEDVEEYVDRNCPTTDEVQWFDFPTIFERLAYRRVESDPRELRDIGEPVERLYGDLGLTEVRLGDYEGAARALKQAIRWNPMNCEHRLNLADIYHISGDMHEYLALTYSVFERASDARHLERAFANFASWFKTSDKSRVAAAALRAARRIGSDDPVLAAALEEASGTDHDPDSVSDTEAQELLGQEGLPDGANAEIAICLLMCASDAAGLGDTNLATTLTVRARDLVGEDAAMTLLQLIRADDAGRSDAHDGDGTNAQA